MVTMGTLFVIVNLSKHWEGFWSEWERPSLACCTSMPRARRSVEIKIREEPERNSRMTRSRSSQCQRISEVWIHAKLGAQIAWISTTYHNLCNFYMEYSEDFCTCWNQTPCSNCGSTRHKSFWSRSACMPRHEDQTMKSHVHIHVTNLFWLLSKWKRLTAAKII